MANRDIVAIIGNPQNHEKEIREIAIDLTNRGHIAIIPFELWPVADDGLMASFALRERQELVRDWYRRVATLATFVIVVNVDGVITDEMELGIQIMSTHSTLFIVSPESD